MDSKGLSGVIPTTGTRRMQNMARMNTTSTVERLTSQPRKRSRDDSHEEFQQHGNHSPKRHNTTIRTSTDDLCEECTSIYWDALDEWLDPTGSWSWWGKPVCLVGKRFRYVPANAACPMCRQLRAPWIEPLLRERNPYDWKEKDIGDEIHIFRNLRHLPHVNDFPEARAILRQHNAPFHIAVVPIGKGHKVGWKEKLREHIAENGMVVVMPNREQAEEEVLFPQQVSQKFNTDFVKPLLKRCKFHRELCNPKPPMVKGMKVIDCQPSTPIIRNHCQEDKYIALSYVWGPSTHTESSEMSRGSTSAAVSNALAIRTRPLQATTHNQRHNHDTENHRIKDLFLVRNYSGMITNLPATTASKRVPRRRLPAEIPLTISDAIIVTKALGYRYLWIDKYCIDQDNEEERQQQCSQMGDIYAGAHLTIFALGEDSGAGLPGVSTTPRLWRRQSTTVGKYKFMHTLQDPQDSIEHSKWATRAWTYQEGLFSTRRLFFTDQQIYFECNAMNITQSFKTNLKPLHILSSQRFRALNRAGSFICGNSNQFSHVNVKKNTANHRKVDIIRQCQWQTRKYTKRELTNNDDVLNAYSGLAHFYAKSSAQIYSLAGITIPFPMAKLPNREPEYLDHLSYALAWSHCTWVAADTPAPQPQRRFGFPSWSWAGWIGEVGFRGDLPYGWTSTLTSVAIRFQNGMTIDYQWLFGRRPQNDDVFRMLLTAKVLHFDAHVLDVSNIVFYYLDWRTSQPKQSRRIHLHMSDDRCDFKELRRKLMTGEYECVVLGRHSEPRKKIFDAIKAWDRKGPKAMRRRIEDITRKPREPHALVCLIVRTNANGESDRIGLIKFELAHFGMDILNFGEKRRFLLK